MCLDPIIISQEYYLTSLSLIFNHTFSTRAFPSTWSHPRLLLHFHLSATPQLVFKRNCLLCRLHFLLSYASTSILHANIAVYHLFMEQSFLRSPRTSILPNLGDIFSAHFIDFSAASGTVNCLLFL